VNILIANQILAVRSGTETYVVDLALELTRRGHRVCVFALFTGPYADVLRQHGIPVVSNLSELAVEPDIIHGNSHLSTLGAVRRFSKTPALFVCHNHRYYSDLTPFHKRIVRYFGVSAVCVRRLIDEGVPPQSASLLLNWVDTERFQYSRSLPAIARKALVFSNYANAKSHLPAIQAACAQANLLLDTVGIATGNPTDQPELLLSRYDIVFAKAKAAMEAMAVGTAVILCDFAGAGPLVTPDNFERLRTQNFGFEALDRPLSAASLLPEIAAYDPAACARVSHMLREAASLSRHVDEIVAIYEKIITEYKNSAQSAIHVPRLYMLRRVRQYAMQVLITVWKSLPESLRKWLKSVGKIQRFFRAIHPH
jgi:hypothetical protein